MSPFFVRSASGGIVSLLNPTEEHPDPLSRTPTPYTRGEPSSPTDTLAPPRQMYPCTHKGCHQEFTTAGHMNRHFKIHTGQREHICPWESCGRRCGRLDNLVQHFRIHVQKHAHTLSNSEVRDAIARMRNESAQTPKIGIIVPETKTLLETWLLRAATRPMMAGQGPSPLSAPQRLRQPST